MSRYPSVLLYAFSLFISSNFISINDASAKRLCKIGSHATAPWTSANADRARRAAMKNLRAACAEQGGVIDEDSFSCGEVVDF